MENYVGVVSDTAREGEAERMRDGAEGKRIPTLLWTPGKLREVANGFSSKFDNMAAA